MSEDTPRKPPRKRTRKRAARPEPEQMRSEPAEETGPEPKDRP